MNEQTKITDRRPNETAIIYDSDGAPVVESVQVELLVSEGPDVDLSVVVPLRGIVVGSHPEAGFRLNDPSVSRRHVELIPTQIGIRACDLQSTNGTYVAGNRISEAELTLGSTLVLGESKIEVRRHVERYPLPLSRRRRLGSLVGNSGAMRQVYALLERAADADVTVLVGGETGTGKELAARALHDHSPRARGPFKVVDCGAVSPTLIEAELFGHQKGSFTGADRDRPGAFEQADGGTLFFDEIGELPLNLQPKLLRALETREIQRIGGSSQMSVDVRFVAATNRDLLQEVGNGNFREDLYYRLNVFKLTMPPLRDHREDIPTLIKHFLAPMGHSELPEELINRMSQMDWPGNVRELRNAVERAVVLSSGDLRMRSTKSRVESTVEEPSAPLTAVSGDGSFDFDSTRPFKEVKAELIERFENVYIREVLVRNKGNISASARESGIDRKHLERLIKKLQIDVKSLS